ncbi:MAG: hypothetical protein V3V08_03065 [Nannocystaceae bacterium]
MLALARCFASLTLGVLASVSAGCVHSPDRLPALDRQFYENLPTEREQREFVALKRGARQAYLDRKNLWQQWENLSGEERLAVAQRSSKVGHREFALHMAWGLPVDVRLAEARGRLVRFETYIRCTSGPKTGSFVRENIACDGTSSEMTVAVEDGLVTQIKHLD